MSDDDTSADTRVEDATPAGSTRPLARIVAAGLVLALGAAVAVAIAQQQRAGDLEQEADDRAAVSLAAASFGEVYLTYDFDDPDRSGDRVLDLVTPEFAEDFSSTRAPGIEELFANLETTTEATTTEVFLGDVSGDAARVLVVVDVVAESAASGTQTLSDLTFVLDLLRIDGAWLVDEVAPAPQPDLVGDGVEPAPTTTTVPTSSTTTAAP